MKEALALDLTWSWRRRIACEYKEDRVLANNNKELVSRRTSSWQDVMTHLCTVDCYTWS